MIQRESFPVTLVFPPQGHFTQPYLALPCLKAWLEAHSFDDVELVDASIEAYDRFLSRDYLARCADRVARRLPLESFAARSEVPFRDLASFRAAAESAASAQALIERIDDSKDVLRTERFYDMEQYVPAVRTIYHALRLVSAAWHPTELTPHNFTMAYSNDRSSDVLAAIRDEEQNPFVAHFRETLLPRLVARKPRVVGMSVIYGSQLIPALTLGRLIKEAMPDCHVTAGGGFLAYIGEKLMRAPGIDACLDSLIFHEGEAPLLGLCNALRDGTPLSNVGSLAWFDRGEQTHTNARARGSDEALVPSSLDRAGTSQTTRPGPHSEVGQRTVSKPIESHHAPGTATSKSGLHEISRDSRDLSTSAHSLTARPVFNTPGHPIKLDHAPIPNFDGLPFDKYLSPSIVIPYDINRGCYYGECTFCTLPTVIGPGYRTRSAATIVDHIQALCDRVGTRNVNFITDCMPPGMIRDLPDTLIRERANIRWWCDARVEPKAYDQEGARRLYEAGCRKLLFGFETATPRLLKMMKKGQSLKSTLDVAKNCTDAGISVTFYAMVGFPTETREEAQATVDFLVEHNDVVREVSLQTFHIDEVAQTYKHAQEFGLTILDEPGADLALYHDYECASGMTQTEAAEMFERMMAALRANLPLFSGDNIFYFMQKSHYFLHLARDVHPDAFVERCRERTERRATLGADPSLAPGESLSLVELPFGYGDALAKLAHPLARAVRPDFLTGRHVAGAEEACERELGSIRAKRSVLAYDGDSAEFAEIRPDGARVIEALRSAGSLGKLIERIDPGERVAREKISAFSAELHRLGILRAESARPAAVRSGTSHG